MEKLWQLEKRLALLKSIEIQCIGPKTPVKFQLPHTFEKTYLSERSIIKMFIEFFEATLLKEVTLQIRSSLYENETQLFSIKNPEEMQSFYEKENKLFSSDQWSQIQYYCALNDEAFSPYYQKQIEEWKAGEPSAYAKNTLKADLQLKAMVNKILERLETYSANNLYISSTDLVEVDLMRTLLFLEQNKFITIRNIEIEMRQVDWDDYIPTVGAKVVVDEDLLRSNQKLYTSKSYLQYLLNKETIEKERIVYCPPGRLTFQGRTHSFYKGLPLAVFEKAAASGSHFVLAKDVHEAMTDDTPFSKLISGFRGSISASLKYPKDWHILECKDAGVVLEPKYFFIISDK